MKKPGGLGKGLEALIPGSYRELIEEEREERKEKPEDPGERMTLKDQVRLVVGGPQTGEKGSSAFLERAASQSGFQMVRLEDIQANPDQPRQDVEKAKIDELALSIREQGLLHPVVVKKAEDNRYEIICGERRVLAARQLGWTEVPAIIKDIASEKLLELALVENIQREDLNAIEEAEAYQKLVMTRAMSPDEVGKRVGRERSTVVNTIRLLRLPEEVKTYIKSGRISAGHARALLALPSPEHQRRMAERIIGEQLSVRQVEELVQSVAPGKRKARLARRLDSEIVDLERRITERLGTKVRVYAGKNQKGRIEIRYNSLDELDRILGAMGVRKG